MSFFFYLSVVLGCINRFVFMFCWTPGRVVPTKVETKVSNKRQITGKEKYCCKTNE